MKIYQWLTFILLAVVVALIFFWPNNKPIDEGKKQYEDTIQVLKVEKATVIAKVDSIVSAANERARKDSLALIASNAEIKVYKRKAAQARAEIPAKVLEDNPEVVHAIAMMDTVNQKLEAQNDSLKASNFNQMISLKSLIFTHAEERRIGSEIIAICEKRNEDLQKDIAKNEKKKTFLGKVVTVLIPIVVVETVLLIVGVGG